MAPKKPDFVLETLAAAARLGLVDQAGGEVGVDRHLLAGHGIEVEARRDLRDATRALRDDHEIHDHQDREHDDADDEIAAHHQIAEGLDDVAGSGGAFVPVREDEPRRGEVERQPQHGRDQQHGREGGEFERRMDEQRRHQDQHGEDDREGERHIQKDGRQWQDEDHEDGHHPDRERDVAALEHRAEEGEPGQPKAAGAVAAAARACRGVRHDVVSRAVPRPVMGMKRLRGGRKAAHPSERNRAGVQDRPRLPA